MIMCLKFVGHGRERKGEGYKAVRQLKLGTPGSYASYFTFFLKGGSGGTLVGFNEAPLNFKDRVVKTQVVYNFNELTRVRHKRLARANNSQLYTAGIHLWLDIEFAKERYRALKMLDDDPNLVLVKFRWSSPIASDGDTVVAARAVPLHEIVVD
jgi:hypothetical protein